MEYLFLLGRVLLGGYFIMNGYGHLKNHAAMVGYAQYKNVKAPGLAVAGTGIMLLLGGLGILLGVYIQIAVLLLAVFLVFVTFKMHQYWKLEGDARMGEYVNFYKNLALLGAILVLLSVPTPWVMSLF